MAKSNEKRLQTRAVEYLAMALPDVMVIAVPNEQAISLPPLPDDIYAVLARHGMIDRMRDIADKQRMIAIMNLKRAGMYPGAADLLLFQKGAGGIECIGALETKDKASQSNNQIKFEKHWTSLGGRYAIWRELPELYEILVNWGLKPSLKPPGHTPNTKKAMQYSTYHQFMLDIARGTTDEN